LTSRVLDGAKAVHHIGERELLASKAANESSSAHLSAFAASTRTNLEILVSQPATVNVALQLSTVAQR
jgi:hypothetical protein